MASIISLPRRPRGVIALPRSCVLCGAVTGTRELLCQPCRGELPPPDPGDLNPLPAPLDGITAAYAYRYPVDRLVRSLKYGRALFLADLLAAGLIERLGETPRPHRVLALPLGRRRERERGYNQAQEIAACLTRRLGLAAPVTGLLVRVRETAAQAGLNAAARQANVADAFRCLNNLQGETVAVVDDVLTSGATLAVAAHALKRAGARQVWAWVAARTPAPDFSGVPGEPRLK